MLSEGAKLTGETGKTYIAVSPLQSNVWTAAEKKDDPNDPYRVVIIKEPGEVDTQPGWPSFQNEMVMHEVFKDSPGIRQQIDRIPPTKPGDPPMIVLEITETTLWIARTKRPWSLAEIKKVAKDVLLGLRDVHAQGLVYADLKPQNIMVDGFNAESEAKDDHLQAKLGDLGLVMEPMNGKVQPITYRAPEVYMRGDITSRVDVWGWGLIYCHLLEARTRFSQTGLYDDLETKTGGMAEREEAVKSALTNDYKLMNDPVYSDVSLPQNDPNKHKGDQWELLRSRGLEDGEVDFLRWVLRADPYQRPTVDQILECGWLEKTEEEVAAGFTPPEYESLEFDPKRATPFDLAAQEKQEAHNNGEYFHQPRPQISEKRYHSAEDDVSVKKMYVPNSNLAPTAEQEEKVSPDASSVKPTTFTPFASSNPTDQSVASSPPVETASAGSPMVPTPFANYKSMGQSAPSTQSIETAPTANPVVPTPFVSSGSVGQQADASTQPVDTSSVGQSVQERPKLSTKNTGTFLSYR